MNLAGDGLMLVIALHQLGDREDAYLNASPENYATSAAFLAPPPRQSPKERGSLRSFDGSTPIDSVASSRGWLTQKRSAAQNRRPARRPVPSCTHRAGLLATRSVASRLLAGAAETRTRQAIGAPACFGEPRREFSTVPLQTGLRPVEAPFHETSVTGLRPVGQDCSAATLGPSANAGLSSGALDSPGEGRPRPHALHGVELAVDTWLRLGAAHLVFTARACHRCPRGGWLRRTRSAGQNHRPARRTVPSCTRRAGLLASGIRPALPPTFPAMPRPFTLDKLPRQRDHRFTNTPRGTHGATHHVIVGRAGSTGLASWHRPLSLPATFDRRFGYLPTRACTRPALRAGG
jgi:hypothetical protein